MTVTKVHIINFVSNHLDLPKIRPTEVVDSLLEIIKKTLEDDENVLISGFGKFCVKGKRERRGRSPHTEEDLMLAERGVVRFMYSPVLRDKINGSRT